MTENIGARRLYTVMEKLLEDVSFSAPDMTENQDGHYESICERKAWRIPGERGFKQIYLVKYSVKR